MENNEIISNIEDFQNEEKRHPECPLVLDA